MKICGLLGRHLAHSYSPQIHACFGKTSYVLWEKEPRELESFLKSGEFDGMNVTIPYKKDVIDYLDELSDMAKAIGSVNTIAKKADGTLFGDNTDAAGFMSMLDTLKADVKGKKCLVLGSGGASMMAQYVLKKLGGEVVVISRSGEDNYNNLERHKDACLIVNATPVGMYPNAGSSPVDLGLFDSLEYVLDLVYNPAKTKLLMDAENLGIKNCGGLIMLVEQARKAAELWSGEKIPDEVSKKTLAKLKADMQNIVLIGMPGCGKSKVGMALSELTGREFVDCDAVITTRIGMTIPEFFEKYGEEAFRREETAALSDICQRSALVISTGGGCITREENYPLLKQNSVVLWLRRDLELLSRKGRPLSQGADLNLMYKVRAPLYEKFCDAAVDSTGVITLTAEKMLEVYNEIISH
ncbi:MAG: shikimate kinase [Oscillospiraceae bacterium]|nr:shikimate kinase [Oscillospiraceae bacterium]